MSRRGCDHNQPGTSRLRQGRGTVNVCSWLRVRVDVVLRRNVIDHNRRFNNLCGNDVGSVRQFVFIVLAPGIHWERWPWKSASSYDARTWHCIFLPFFCAFDCSCMWSGAQAALSQLHPTAITCTVAS